MKSIKTVLFKWFSVLFSSQRKHKRHIATLYFILIVFGICILSGQIKQTGLFRWKMFQQRNFAWNSSFSWNSVLDALENTHSLKGDILPAFKGKTKSENTSEKLKVVVLLHSHNDPGYKKTYDVYYHSKTKHVLSLAVKKLMEYKDLTFIWTDTCFLNRWWKEQNTETKTNLKHLVETGRFEISLGAWVSADECVTHYFAYIDQLIEGYTWIRRHFDVFPNISFNMDQFGTSSSVHFIRKNVGIKYSVYNHLHKGTKVFFRKNRLLEFNLRQSLVDNMDSFVHVEPFDDLSFRGSCGPSSKVCSRLNLRYTTLINKFESFATELVSQLRLKSDMYLHNVILLPLGDDLVYTTEKEWDNEYKSLKILMNFINVKKQFNVHMQFGTLSQYFGELEKSSAKHSVQFPKVSGDLFPYTRGAKYWSGYFTTRQFMKRLGRELQESVKAVETLMAFAAPIDVRGNKLSNEARLIISKLIHARRELGLFQHHDAITGTSETSVIKDYKQRLSTGITESQEVMANLIKSLLEKKCESAKTSENGKCIMTVFSTIFRDDAETLTKPLVFHFQRNESQFVMFNSLTQSRNELLSFVVKHYPDFLILDRDGDKIYYDVQHMNGRFVVSFIANLSAMSVSIYNLVKTELQKGYKTDARVNIPRKGEDMECENSDISVKFSNKDGSPYMICSKKESACRRFESELIHYRTASDAYTFANDNTYTKTTEIRNIQKISGKSFCSVEVDYGFIRIKFTLQHVKGLSGQRLEMDIYDDLSGREFLGEFAVRIKTDIKNNKEFYTDSNGMQLKKRIFRKQLSFGGNIYPMTSMAVIEDKANRLNVYSTQPHGIVSTEQGWIDITIDRVVVAKSDSTVSEFRENTFDNLPTSTHLFFKFETIYKSTNKLETPENIGPTLESVMTDDFVQHPVYAFHALANSKPTQHEFSYLNRPVSSELVIANIKTLFGDDLVYLGTSLTLFRRFISHEVLRNVPIVLNPESLFRIPENTIRFLFNNEKVSNNSFIFKPFDLRTFVLQ